MVLHRLTVLACLAASASLLWAEPGGLLIQSASFVGGAQDGEALTGAAIQSDGTIVLAGNLGRLTGDGYDGARQRAIGRISGDRSAAVLLLSGDGKKLLAITRLPGAVHDLAIDGDDAIYLAAGDAGLLKLSRTAGKVLWTQEGPGPCTRVDADMERTRSDVVAFFGGDEATGAVMVVSYGGKRLGVFSGHQKTKDVAIDPGRRRVFVTGFKNDRGKGTPGSKWADGAPVQVAYLLAMDYDGRQLWKAYDWPGSKVGYVDGGLNSMADTRGLRVSVGADGKLYAAFMSAGGDHIFRYDPLAFGQKATIVGGDKYHEFYNSASEHKGLYGRFDPDTGRLLAMQQFCSRLSSGKANAAWSNQGQIIADREGRVFVTGSAASGLPLTWDPFEGQAYTGGGFLVIWSPDFRDRLACLRLATSGHLHAVAVRKVPGRSTPTVVIAGGTRAGDQPPIAYIADALQARPGSADDGLFGVIGPRTAVGSLAEDESEAALESGPSSAKAQAGATVTPDDPREVAARANLGAAQRLLERGDQARAERLLQRILREWPQTDAAVEARAMLGQ